MKAIGAISVAILILAVAVGVLDMTGGPTSESSGVVKSVAMVPSGTGRPEQVASVVLANGSVVQAKVLRTEEARPGREVRLLVHRRIISGASSYEVVEPMKEGH